MTQPPLARNACQQRSHKGRLVPGEPGKGIDASHGDLARDRHPWPWMCYSPMHSKSTRKLRTREPSAGTVSSSVHDGTFPHEDV
jgi:hypothetical protein